LCRSLDPSKKRRLCQISLNSNGDFITVTDGKYQLQIFQIFFGQNGKLNANLVYAENMKSKIGKIMISGNHNLLLNLDNGFKGTQS